MQAELANNPAAASTPADAKGLEVTSAFTANVWEVKCKAGDKVTKGQTLMVLEAMKMEYPVAAPQGGHVLEVMVEGNSLTHQGDVLAVIGPEE